MAFDPGQKHHGRTASRVVVVWALLTAAAWAALQDDALLQAARKGDLAGVKKSLDDGADVNGKSSYGASALSFAAEKGKVDIVKLLLDRGANVNVQDQFYKARPITWAVRNGHAEIVGLLLAHDALLPTEMLSAAISEKKMDVAAAIIASGKADVEMLEQAMTAAALAGNETLVKQLEAAGVTRPNVAPAYHLSPEALRRFEGTFRTGRGTEITFVANETTLTRTVVGQPPLTYRPVDGLTFESVELPGIKIQFTVEDGRAINATVFQQSKIFMFERVEAPVVGAMAGGLASRADFPEPAGDQKVTEPAPWPGFRGHRASGVADGQHPPVTWDVTNGENVRWKTPIPGLAHSSPIVWGDRVFTATAVASDANPAFRPDLYSDVTTAEDDGTQSWRVYCLDKLTGKILWDKVAHEGVPRSRRHLKSSHANCTPATDGEHLIVSFGSEGLYCYDFDGVLKWKVDLGDLDSGWFYDPEYQWGYASSPIIYKDMVIVQADVDRGPYIAAFNIDDGKQVWRTAREEVPSWSTPTIFETAKRTDLVVNATKYIRGYDPTTGAEVWRLGRNSEITVAAPVVGGELVFVTGGYPPIRPLYAIKAGATGDITLPEETTSNEFVSWARPYKGTYLPTPIVYRDLLYTCRNDGLLTCYTASSGEEHYREYLGGGAGGGYSASPIAADGRLYLFSEDGDVYVVGAGTEFQLVAHNIMGEVCMATPAISDGMLIVRTRRHVYGLGRASDKPARAGD